MLRLRSWTAFLEAMPNPGDSGRSGIFASQPPSSSPSLSIWKALISSIALRASLTYIAFK
jgi:hypothetical protein